MTKRNIYREPAIGQLQQGYIFNQAVAERYGASDVCGVIVTPRCDIENAKVMTFHYLPLIPFQDWLLSDYWLILKKILISDLEQNINTILQQNGHSSNLLGKFKLEDIRDKFAEKINKKQQGKFNKAISWLAEITALQSDISKPILDRIHSEKNFNKIGENILKELSRNNRPEYYLVEHWEEADKYYVVLLRDIQKISWDLGMRIAQGMPSSELKEADLLNNDIKHEEEGFVYPIKVITSPFIEHLIQKLFNNFGKIGITDHEPDLNQKLISANIV
jgi:hypothetical protein